MKNGRVDRRPKYNSIQGVVAGYIPYLQSTVYIATTGRPPYDHAGVWCKQATLSTVKL